MTQPTAGNWAEDTDSDVLPVARVWSFHPWRAIPPLLVLATVAAIWATRFDPLIANHWAFPLLLVVIGAIALVLVFRSRPRRVQRPLPYPD